MQKNISLFKKTLFFVFLNVLLGTSLSAKVLTVDLNVFSFDRPLQLYAFLESAEKFLSGVQSIHVIYRVSAPEYEKAYKDVAKRFPKAIFHKQTVTPTNNFKSLVLSSVLAEDSPTSYFMFAVDDQIVKDFVNLEECVRSMEEHKAWCFSLRLGKNISHFYMKNEPSPPPKGKNTLNNLFIFKFSSGTGDWAYPNSVDLNIYRKKDVQKFLKKENYTTPNSLESDWQKYNDLKQIGICFLESKAVNIPLNLVNKDFVDNRNANLYTPKELLAKYNQGLKMDIGPISKKRFPSVHVDYNPTFIKR